MKTLVTATIPEHHRPELMKFATDVQYAGRGLTGYRLSPKQMAELMPGVELLIDGVEEVNAGVMDAAGGSLKIIVCCRNEAFGSIDVEAATKRGLPVLSAAGRNAVSVAEFTIGLLLALCKNISKTDYLMRHTTELCGKTYADKKKEEMGTTKKPPSFWSTDPKGPGALYGGYPELKGKTFGQIGYGTIGREVAKRAYYGFEMDLLVCDPVLDEVELAGMRAKKVDLPTLMEEADFISINCNVNPSTEGMISREMLQRMKPTAYLVNTARAPIMDYDALYDILKEGRIRGAALDVYPVEPIEQDNKLLTLDNVVLTPHLAAQATKEISDHQCEIIFENLHALLRGERPRTLVNPEVLPGWLEKHRELLIP